MGTPRRLGSLERAVMDQLWDAGGPQTVRAQLQQIVNATHADELIVAGAVHAHAARLLSYEILAGLKGDLHPAA